MSNPSEPSQRERGGIVVKRTGLLLLVVIASVTAAGYAIYQILEAMRI